MVSWWTGTKAIEESSRCLLAVCRLHVFLALWIHWHPPIGDVVDTETVPGSGPVIPFRRWLWRDTVDLWVLEPSKNEQIQTQQISKSRFNQTKFRLKAKLLNKNNQLYPIIVFVFFLSVNVCSFCCFLVFFFGHSWFVLFLCLRVFVSLFFVFYCFLDFGLVWGTRTY